MLEFVLYGFMWAIFTKVFCLWNPKGMGDAVVEFFKGKE